MGGGYTMEGDWDHARQRLQVMRRRRRRQRSHRTGLGAGLAWRTSTMTSDLCFSGPNYSTEQQNSSSTDSISSCSSIYRRKGNSIPKGAMIRHSSSSVIAELMAIDEFSSLRVDPKQMKTIGRWNQKPSSGVFQDKDILEVVKKSMFETNNLPNHSSCDSDLTFSSRSIIDEKDFSSCKPLERTREYNEVIEYQNNYENYSVNFQQQPGSRFTKDPHNLKWLELSHQSRQSTNVASLNGIKHGKNKLFYRFDGLTGKSLLNRSKSPGKKLTTEHFLHSLKDQRASLSHTFAKLWHSNQNDAPTQPSKIVLLKPSLEKADSTRRASFPPSIENISLSKRWMSTHSTFMDAKRSNKENMPLYIKVIDGSKSKGSRGIAREITKYMKLRFSTKYFRDNTCVFSRYNLHNHDASQNSFGLSSACKKTYSSSASLSEFTREGRNEKMCYQSNETIYHGSCTNTLGEMFALSDREELKRTFKVPTVIRRSDQRSSPAAKIPVESHNSSRFSNLDSHKDLYLIKIPKSTSLSAFARNYASSRLVQDVRKDRYYMQKNMPSLWMGDFMHRNLGRGGSLPKVDLKIGSKKFQSVKYIGKEDKLPQQMFTQTQELEKESYVRSPEFDVFNFSDDNKADSGNELYVSKYTLTNTLVKKSMDISLQTKSKDTTRDDSISYGNKVRIGFLYPNY